jgi:hypothetical protein
MFGDLIGIRGRRVIIIPPGVSNGVVPSLHGNTIKVVAPLPLEASYKITEDESPRPQNRAYVAYSFYDNVDRFFERNGTNDLLTRLPTITGAPAQPVFPGHSDLHRETVGFEQTFLNGDASFGLRLPFLQLVGDRQVEDTQVGDLSLILKYALINNRQTGNVFSTGVVFTLPTGPGLVIPGESSLHSTIIQPWVGFIYNFGDLYVQEFSSAAVPTDMRDVAVVFNSIGAGYWLYRDRGPCARIQGLVPVLELHLNTPLNHRGLEAGVINFPDALDLTGGCHILLRRTKVGFAVCTPLTGPKPYDIEAAANLEFRW